MGGEGATTPTLSDVGIGYTLATGRLFCDMADFHAFAEETLGRQILTHEFANQIVWQDIRTAFEEAVVAGGSAGSERKED